MRTRDALATTLAARPHAEPIHFITIKLPGGPELRVSDRYIGQRVRSILVSPAGPAEPAVETIVNGTFPAHVEGWTLSGTGGGVTDWQSDGGLGRLRLSALAIPSTATGSQVAPVKRARTYTPSFQLASVSGATGSLRVTLRNGAGGGVLYQTTINAVDLVVQTYTLPAIVAPDYQIEYEFHVTSQLAIHLDNISLFGGAAPAVAAQHQNVVWEEVLGHVLAWGAIEERLNPQDGGGSPATLDGLTLVNNRPIGGRARFTDLIRSPYNPTGYELAFAELRVYRMDAERGPGTEELLGVFYLEDPTELDERIIRLRGSDVTLVMEQQLVAAPITRARYPDVAPSAEDGYVPIPFGRLQGVSAAPIGAGVAATLSADLTDSATTLVLEDATRLPASGTVMVDAELITYTSRTETQLLGATRGALGSAAAAHSAGTRVYPLRESYLYEVAQAPADYPVGAVTNVRVNGAPARTNPTIELAGSSPDTGRRSVLIRFTPADVLAFHVYGSGADNPITVAAISVVRGTAGTTTQVRTVPVPTGFETPIPSHRTMSCSIELVGGSSFTWAVRRKVTGGAAVRIASGTQADLPASFTHTARYPSLADEQIEFEATCDANGVNIKLSWSSYVIEPAPGREQDSTAGVAIGTVTCDLDGLTDPTGAIAETPGAVLEIPADIVAVLLTLYPGRSLADRGPHWAATRASQAAAGLRWAFLLGVDGPERFSDLRRLIGTQARSWLMTEAGKLDLRFVPDVAPIDLVLDYRRDVWEEQPVVTLRTARTQLFNRVVVSAQPDLAGEYRYSITVEDLSQPGLREPIETTLELPWVQDRPTADHLGAFWLRWWKRARFQADAVGWQNLLATEKLDRLAVDNHPVLLAHGGAALPFLIYGKQYRLGDDNPSRIQVALLEAAP